MVEKHVEIFHGFEGGKCGEQVNAKRNGRLGDIKFFSTGREK